MTANGYRVTAKGRACNNAIVRDRFFARGEMKDFDSRDDAERFARHATRKGCVRVVVQAAAPQDDTCDAYLVAIPARNTAEPANPDDDFWAFQTDANQQGALGELLATTPTTNPPAFTWFVRQDLDDPDSLTVRVDDAPDPISDWRPDARIVATIDGTTAATYHCEVKTGNASFRPGQRDGMDRAACHGRVLIARVHIDSLPDEYRVHVHEYPPKQ